MARKKEDKSKFKLIFIIIFLSIFTLTIYTVFSIFKWQSLAEEIMRNTSSIIVDKNEELIAEIGAEKNRKNISFEDIPDNLKNAYVAIEDKRFYSHFRYRYKKNFCCYF